MQSRQMRAEQMNKLMHDPDIGVGEATIILWDFLRLEYAFYRRAKADRAVEKAGKRFNIHIEVVNFRKRLADL